MKKNLTELVFILDRSGSMAGLEKDTIGGFNAMIEKQKAEEGEAYISTVLFDNYSQITSSPCLFGYISIFCNKKFFIHISQMLLILILLICHI